MTNRTGILESFFPAAALLSVTATLCIPLIMIVAGLPFFTGGNVIHLLTGTWSPVSGEFGIAPMIAGSMVIALFSCAIAFPLSLGYTALILVYAPPALRLTLERFIYIMSGIPTVVYGFVGMVLLVPLIREKTPAGSGLSILTATLLLSLLITPTMILMFHQSTINTPERHLMAIRASGGTVTDLLLHGYLPGSGRGIIAGLLLGFGRAVSDTLIVLMVAGNSVAVPSSLFDSARSLTSHIALVFAADFNSSEFRSVYACGLVLYLITSVIALTVRNATRLTSRSG